jgi:prepilin-type N-terminal cleavage/methylation domain-containing protein
MNVPLFSIGNLVHSKRTHRAFTLIEVMVAVSIFAIVMLIGVGALLSLVQTNRRAQGINSVMSNLNAAIESMSRTMRVGGSYHCETSPTLPSPSVLAEPQDCSSGGGVLLAFESSRGDSLDDDDQVVYRLNGTQLERSLYAGANGTWVALTSPDISIDSFQFYVVGSTPGDTIQPRILMSIEGSAAVPGGSTHFTVQAGVVQRLLDL